MKRPYYYLLEDVAHRPEFDQEIVFKSGTLITPIMDDRYLPKHLESEIIKMNQYNKEERYVMCSLGIYWIPVQLSKIKEVI